MKKLSKTIKHTVQVESKYLGKPKLAVLKELEEMYRDMVANATEYAVVNGIKSLKKLHQAKYKEFRQRYPDAPSRLVKGAIADALRRAKSFLALKRKGKAYTDKPEVKQVTITYNDDQDWKFKGDAILLKTHKGWIEIPLRVHRYLRKHLEEGWKLAKELKFKLVGRKAVFYLVFQKEFEVQYNEKNVVAVDVNESNVTVAVFQDGNLVYLERIEMQLDRIVIAYAEKRRRILKGHSWTERGVRKRMKKLSRRERNRKDDILHKVAKRIADLALQYNAVVVVGDVGKHKRKIVERQRWRKMRHRLFQWSVQKLVKYLEAKPVHVELINESRTSSWDFITGKKIKNWIPSVTRIAVRRGCCFLRVKVLKIRLRYGNAGTHLVERDFNGAINIGLKYLRKNSDVRASALSVNAPHDAPVILMIGGRRRNPSPIRVPVVIRSD